MSFNSFSNSQFFKRRSSNLSKLGFNFEGEPQTEYLKIQSMLFSMYFIQGESMLTIMKAFDIPSSKTMDTIFKLFEIESRTCSERTLNAISKNRLDPQNALTFKHIYHTTWYNEIVYLRSSYELDLAKLLDLQKEFYLVESLRIKYFSKKDNKYKIAIPDFFLPKSNTIIEVKSTYWLDENQMNDKKESYLSSGYNFKLYLDHKFVDCW